ncbi:MAG: glycoside hydrolase family 127 protein [Verrucomicrobia bacterium]|nr:glycoside hydrolase family 127 protein [Verrucomicrobiota bacterium]
MKHPFWPPLATLAFVTGIAVAAPAAAEPAPRFNRAPLTPKPYAELPLGAIAPKGWLEAELRRMAAGMTGQLDLWYPEVCGPRNAWLGGDGDTWERGPYWIDGLYPLARLLRDDALVAKAMRWIDWTLAHQRDDGYFGPRLVEEGARTRPPPAGAQVHKPDDWWPRMVMLKILQQHYDATRDPRVVEALRRYFRYQLAMLPSAPLKAPPNGQGGSWWAEQRGADNLHVVLWLYNLTGETWLLDLAQIVHRQTLPFTEIFLAGDVLKLWREHGQPPGFSHPAFHCVNLAQGMKAPLIRYQQDGDPRHLAAVKKGLLDLEILHGQPHGLYGADEGMHGRGLDRGSELCTAVEFMFSLEKMLEITGDPDLADRLEKIAFNPLPTQCTDDHRYRQYFQQANQVAITAGERAFYNEGGERLVYGLLTGYPCCTCNYHQGWPKFVQHLWFATADRGLAALAYGPSAVTTRVADDREVTITEETRYPFEETIRLRISTRAPVSFPLHLRIPGWCREAAILVNGEMERSASGGRIEKLARTWRDGDTVELRLPMRVRTSRWFENSAAIERGPLVYALRLAETWTDVPRPAPAEASGPVHRGYREVRTTEPWNFALLQSALQRPDEGFRVVTTGATAANPWSLEGAPLELHTQGVRLPDWTLHQHSAGPVPHSPVYVPDVSTRTALRLVPYGCTTLRIAAFPWIDDQRPQRRR